MTSERVLATLLFTDIVGSTERAASLGDRRWRELKARHHALVRREIARFGGSEVDTAGDGFLVTFERPLLGIRCACAIRDAVRSLGLEIRAGLHAGEVEREAGSVTGIAVHIGARVAAQADAGEVLVSGTVKDLVAGASLKFDDRGVQTLRGVPGEWRLFAVLDPGFEDTAAAGSLPESRTGRTPFVGREQELATLHRCLDAAQRGQGQLVLVGGEPGVGKTRLLAELAEGAKAEGWEVLAGRAYDSEGMPPYLPFSEALRDYVRTVPVEDLRAQIDEAGADVALLAPDIRRRLADLPTSPPAGPEEQRYRLFESVCDFLLGIAGHSEARGLVLILDDLHWADPSSLLLFQHLARRLTKAPLLLAVAYRSEEVSRTHPLASVLADLRREGIGERLGLAPLPAAAIEALVRQLAGVAPDPVVLQAVEQQTEGNPFFVGEVVRDLLANRRDLTAPATAAEASGLPEGVREVIERRLGRLAPRTHRLLQTAAILGDSFDLQELRAAVESPPLPLGRQGPPQETEGRGEGTGLSDALDEATGAGMLREVSDGYQFAHALIRQTLHDGLGLARRQELHLRAAEALERVHAGNLGPQVAALAMHYRLAGGQGAKALGYAERAAERALASYAYEEAARHLEQALQVQEALDPDDKAKRCDLLLAEGEAWWAVGTIPKAREAFQLAAEAAQSLGMPEPLVRAALGYGGVWLEGGPVLVTLLERALNALAGHDSALRARVLARLSLELSRAPGASERSAALSGQATEMARRVGDPTVLAYALSTGNTARLGLEYVEERLSAAATIAKLAEETGDIEMGLQGHQFLFIGLLERGDIAAADLELEVCARLAEEFRQPLYLENNLTHRAARALIEGRLEEAEHLGEQAQAIGKDLAYSAAPDYVPHLFVLRREQGRLGELDAVAMGFFEQHSNLAWVRAMKAVLSSELDREPEARRELEHLAANDFAGITRDNFWLASLALLSEVCAALGDTQSATTLYDLQLPYTGRNVVAGWAAACLGSAARYLGLLATTLERWEAAATHFEAALAMNLRMGARPWVAHSQHGYAVMLLARGATDDQEKAQQLLDQALATALELGMVRLAEQISHLAPRPTSL